MIFALFLFDPTIETGEEILYSGVLIFLSSTTNKYSVEWAECYIILGHFSRYSDGIKKIKKVLLYSEKPVSFECLNFRL